MSIEVIEAQSNSRLIPTAKEQLPTADDTSKSIDTPESGPRFAPTGDDANEDVEDETTDSTGSDAKTDSDEDVDVDEDDDSDEEDEDTSDYFDTSSSKVPYILGGVALLGAALWWRRRRKQRIQRQNRQVRGWSPPKKFRR